MALNIEIGGANAEAYLPVEDITDGGVVTRSGLKTYAGRAGISLLKPDGSAASEAELESALVQGTIFVDSLEPRIFGKRSSGDQALAWPRTGAKRLDGTAVSSGSVPKAVRDASCWAAGYSIANPDDVNTVFSQHLLVKSERVEGVVDVEYQDLEDVSSFKRVLVIVEELMASLLQPSDAEKTASSEQRPVGWITTGRSRS